MKLSTIVSYLIVCISLGRGADAACIAGTVTEDVNNDDIGDDPLSNVMLTLMDPSGIVVGTTLTDSNGNYEFCGLPAGTYSIVETNPPTYTDISDSDGANDNTILVTVTADENSVGNDYTDEIPSAPVAPVHSTPTAAPAPQLKNRVAFGLGYEEGFLNAVSIGTIRYADAADAAAERPRRIVGVIANPAAIRTYDLGYECGFAAGDNVRIAREAAAAATQGYKDWTAADPSPTRADLQASAIAAGFDDPWTIEAYAAGKVRGDKQ